MHFLQERRVTVKQPNSAEKNKGATLTFDTSNYME